MDHRHLNIFPALEEYMKLKPRQSGLIKATVLSHLKEIWYFNVQNGPGAFQIHQDCKLLLALSPPLPEKGPHIPKGLQNPHQVSLSSRHQEKKKGGDGKTE